MIYTFSSRLLQTIVLIIIISVVTFAIVNLSPGLPAIVSDLDMGADDRARIIEDLGLNEPLHVRYFDWASGILRGDLGESLSHRRPVWSLIRGAIPPTVLLATTAFAVGVLVSIPLGVISAIRRNSILDHIVTAVSYSGISVPNFWFALILIIIFGIVLGWLPISGLRTLGQEASVRDTLAHLVMPAIVVSTGILAPLIRYTRSSVLEVLEKDYLRTARAKGVPENLVVIKHALRNALFPVITVMGVMFPQMLGGAAVVELVFAWPGVGRLAIISAIERDFPVVMGVTILISTLTILGNWLIDVLYTFLDPRLRSQG